METEMPLDIERLGTLVANRFPGAKPRIERIPAGLGDRRFYRIWLDRSEAATPRSLVARIEPNAPAAVAARPPFRWLPEPPLEPIRTLLENAGLPVPRSYLHEAALGIDLLEDVGSKTIADTTGQTRRERYLEAGALIPRLQAIHGAPESAPAFGRFFDVDLIRTKAAKVIHWTWPGLLGREASPEERESIQTGFEAIAALLAEAPRRLSHRDFKAENLHLAAATAAGTTPGTERLVMIDVQGAFMAPPEYDLVCLLRDLQVELPEHLVEEVSEAVRAGLPDTASRQDSQRRFDAIAVVRVAKDLAHVVEAGRARGDLRRWHEIPRGLALLEAAVGRLEHTFAPIRALSFVIHVLTQSAETSDIEPSRQGQ